MQIFHTNGGDEELVDRCGGLVAAVRAPQLLHGLLRRPWELEGDVEPAAVVRLAAVRLQ